ncbi:hypothetical protein KY290_036845 [Solanum tuberosum]|uniref:Uncharacterized protein n=1 Tax=Solanum tuberosum TaxID=4113 RepID=A0ABQ7TXN7_SOLTU|nr:hypothetical protein KY284_037381 [Solanum tuberosum]KAH0637993.1 hypothetical protein KY289_037908 [Solanum tuberosum]KAH0738140.1 hypothetical protein KY290_036845 [Solanum tuberosum]
MDKELATMRKKKEDATLEIKRLREKYLFLDKEYLKALGIIKSLEGTTSTIEHENTHKTSAYHTDQKGHTIDKCVKLKTVIRDLINVEKISYMCGHYTLFTCDQPEPGMPVTEDTSFHCHYFTPLEAPRRTIYYKLVRGGILTPTKKNIGMVFAFGGETFEACHYHSTRDHNIEKCLVFFYDVESLINKGRIQVKFPHVVRRQEECFD